MAGEQERVDTYLDTISRIEPDITAIDAAAFYASAAISLKRIADAWEETCRLYANCTGQPTKYWEPPYFTRLQEEQEYCVGCDKAVTAAQVQSCAHPGCMLSAKAPIKRG